jgi:hypothetical protein
MTNIKSQNTTTESTINFPTTTDELKESSSKHNLSKFDYDLFHEEDDKTEKIIRVKHFNLPNNGDRWKIFENNKILHTIEGSKLTKKEKNFLKSVDGAVWLLSKAKSGIKSFNALKTEIKKKVKEIPVK